MDQEDFVSKLREIEEQANLLAADSPSSLKMRCAHIALIARVLRGRLEGGIMVVTNLGPRDGKLPA